MRQGSVGDGEGVEVRGALGDGVLRRHAEVGSVDLQSPAPVLFTEVSSRAVLSLARALSNAVKPEWRFIFFLSPVLYTQRFFCIVSVRQPINFPLYNSTVLFTPHRIPLGHKYSPR